MPVTTSVKVEGLGELIANMRDLNNKTRRKFIRSAAFAGAKVIEKAAEGNAPVKTGKLKSLISTRRSRKFSNTEKGYEQRDIGVFKPKGKRVKFSGNAATRKLAKKILRRIGPAPDDAYYWRFLEFGTVKFRPGVGLGFLRRAFESSKQQAADATIARLRADIEKFGK